MRAKSLLMPLSGGRMVTVCGWAMFCCSYCPAATDAPAHHASVPADGHVGAGDGGGVDGDHREVDGHIVVDVPALGEHLVGAAQGIVRVKDRLIGIDDA